MALFFAFSFIFFFIRGVCVCFCEVVSAPLFGNELLNVLFFLRFFAGALRFENWGLNGARSIDSLFRRFFSIKSSGVARF